MYEERYAAPLLLSFVSMSRGGLLANAYMWNKSPSFGIHPLLLPRCCTVLGLNKASEEDIYAAFCYYLARHKTLITKHCKNLYRSTQIISQMKLFLIKVLVLALTTGEGVHAQVQDSNRPVTSLCGSVVSMSVDLQKVYI